MKSFIIAVLVAGCTTRVQRVVAVYDVGKIVNEKLARMLVRRLASRASRSAKTSSSWIWVVAGIPG
jgi:hypothetical protein